MDKLLYLEPFIPEKEMHRTVDLQILESTLATFECTTLTHLAEPEGLRALRSSRARGHHRRSSCKAGSSAF